MNLDLLAYAILALSYVFGVVPLLGASISGKHGSIYKDDFKLGAVVHLILIVFFLVLASVVWATYRVILT